MGCTWVAEMREYLLAVVSKVQQCGGYVSTALIVYCRDVSVTLLLHEKNIQIFNWKSG